MRKLLIPRKSFALKTHDFSKYYEGLERQYKVIDWDTQKSYQWIYRSRLKLPPNNPVKQRSSLPTYLTTIGSSTTRDGLLTMATQSSPRSHGMELLLAYHQNPSIQVRNQLVQLNAGLVRKIAHRMSYQSPEAYEDLEQIGYLGLIRAIERFDPGHGCAFSSFAVPYIRGEIMHFLRDRSSAIKVPRRWQDLYRQGQKIRETLMQEAGQQPKDEEIAEKLGIAAGEWQQIKAATLHRVPLSLDATITQQIDSTVTLGDILPDSHYQTLQLWEEDRQQLQKALSQLEDKTRAAIEFVYYGNLSRKEVAERIGVSPMTVTRRIHRGMQQMIAFLQPQAL